MTVSNLASAANHYEGELAQLGDSYAAACAADIDALRDFWIAQADLDMALVGKPSLTAAAVPAMAAGPAGDPGH